jgi:hypothetical protein
MVKLSLCIPCSTYGRVQVLHHLVLTSALNGGSRMASRPKHRVLGKKGPSYQMNEWVNSRTSLETLEKKRKNSLLSGLQSCHYICHAILDWQDQNPRTTQRHEKVTLLFCLSTMLGMSTSSWEVILHGGELPHNNTPAFSVWHAQHFL